MRAALTNEDLRVLVRGERDEDRAEAAHKLCRTIEASQLDDGERARAQDILRIMAADAADLVRRALAVTLKESPLLPRDVALRLANDVDSICAPILRFSPAFSDEDLVAIVAAGGAIHHEAIARRARLSQSVCEVLVEKAGPEAVRLVCANDNAELGETGLQKAIDRFGDDEGLLETIAYRRVLPLSVTERLIALVSDQIADHLVTHHALSAETALQLSVGARERATVDLIDQAGRSPDITGFVAHLHRSGRLSASFLLRALARGQMSVFEHGLAELAGVPHHRTWLMIHDAGPLGLRAIYERAGLPARLFPAFRACVDTFHALEAEEAVSDLDHVQMRMIERFLTQGDRGGREDVDYLLERLDLARRAA